MFPFKTRDEYDECDVIDIWSRSKKNKFIMGCHVQRVTKKNTVKTEIYDVNNNVFFSSECVCPIFNNRVVLPDFKLEMHLIYAQLTCEKSMKKDERCCICLVERPNCVAECRGRHYYCLGCLHLWWQYNASSKCCVCLTDIVELNSVSFG